jgi:single-strand DNA-binding protein
MASLNKVQIIGNVGKDPEIRSFPDGGLVANVTVATTDKWKDKNTGEKKESTEWHRISFMGRLAEIVEQYVVKGAPIYVEGSLHTRKYTDQGGAEKYVTEVKAQSLQLLGARPEPRPAQGEAGGYYEAPRQQAPARQAPQQPAPPRQAAPQRPPAPRAGSGFDDFDSDIPF